MCPSPQANAPYMRSSAADGEHAGPVWAVRWQPSAAAAGKDQRFFLIKEGFCF